MEKKSILTSVNLVIFILLFSVNLFSQGKKIKPPEISAPVHNDQPARIMNDAKIDVQTQDEITNLQHQMFYAKQSGNIDGVLQIQKDLDRITGSVTMPGEKMDLRLVETKENPNGQDNINAGLVSSVTGVKGIASCTEQVGPTASRIWSSFVFGPNSGATPDMLRICYSDDGGRSWNERVTLAFSSGNRMWTDQIDAEMIENSSGDKYLWTIFGYGTNNYTGQYRVGVTIVKITGALNYGGYTLTWPGAVNSNFYYKPRITSDNQSYPSNPWIYITTCYDSAIAGGYNSGEKVAVCYSPYTVTPTFTYKPVAFTGIFFRYPVDYNCDIAYFKNGGQDSILIIETSLEDSSKIDLMKSSIFAFGTNSYGTYIGNITTSSSRRYQGYIASAGSYNNLMIVNMRKYSSTDWDIEYFRSTNGSAGWFSGYVDYRSNNSTRADIVGFRSAPGTYAVAYSENNLSFVPVVYCEASNNVWGAIVPQMNGTNTNPFTTQPRPGIKYGPVGESCFALWTEYSGSTNVWASLGCSGNIGTYRNIWFRGVMQGFWDAPADTMRNDTLTLLLRKDVSPYLIVDSSKMLLSNDGLATFWFTNTQNYVNYYIVAKHRNSIETWSASSFQFTPASVSYTYDFTSAPSQAYGSNETQVDILPDLYAFYSGDVNQDGTVDLSDIILIYNDANNFVSGYVNSDVNGDSITDLSDVILTYNNANSFVSLIRP